MAGLYQIYELNLSPKSVKSQLINLRFYSADKVGRLNLALKFNKKLSKFMPNLQKQTAKCQIWQKRHEKAHPNEPRRKNE